MSTSSSSRRLVVSGERAAVWTGAIINGVGGFAAVRRLHRGKDANDRVKPASVAVANKYVTTCISNAPPHSFIQRRY